MEGIDSSNLARGRVYTLKVYKAKGNTDLVDDKCYLLDKVVMVLFNSSAYHSFISMDFIIRLNIPTFELESPMIVSTAVNINMETSIICKDCPLYVSGAL